MSLTIRQLEAADRERWEPLWHGYHAFYRSPDADVLADPAFARLCAGEEMLGLLALSDAAIAVGFAHLVFHPTTWSAAPSCYLEDLFVDPAARGSGAARQLIEAVYATARERGADRVYWTTQQFNGRARSLYDTVATLTSYVVYEHTP